jgi:hypothetical protein
MKKILEQFAKEHTGLRNNVKKITIDKESDLIFFELKNGDMIDFSCTSILKWLSHKLNRYHVMHLFMIDWAEGSWTGNRHKWKTLAINQQDAEKIFWKTHNSYADCIREVKEVKE